MATVNNAIDNLPEGRDDKGRFVAGNRFWEARSSHGRNPIFETPEALWSACVEYFEWVEANPLWEYKPFAFQGTITMAKVPKMRAMTIGGLCNFLDIAQSTWFNWALGESDFLEITTRVDSVIRAQKFEGAAADLLNANIIARDLGLSDKSEITGKDGGPIKTEDVSARELIASRLAGLTTAGQTEGDT